MIEFTDGYKIEYDGILNWVLSKKHLNKKTGTYYYADNKYFGTLKDALVSYTTKYGLNNAFSELEDAYEILEVLDNFQQRTLECLDRIAK